MDTGHVFGIIITVSIFITYIPQYYKIFKYKSSNGISHHTLFLALISSSLPLCNAVVFYFDVINNCVHDLNQCSLDLLGFFQFIIRSSSILLYYTLFLIYLKKDTKIYRITEFRYFFTSLIIICCIVITTIISLFAFECNENENDFCVILAKSYGYFNLSLVFLQFFPQIYKILKEQDIGSISLVTLVLQISVNVLWTTYLILDTELNVTTWITYLGITSLQITLLSICIFFEIKSCYYLHKNNYNRVDLEENTQQNNNDNDDILTNNSDESNES